MESQTPTRQTTCQKERGGDPKRQHAWNSSVGGHPWGAMMTWSSYGACLMNHSGLPKVDDL
jgi:hypothetical protein